MVIFQDVAVLAQQGGLVRGGHDLGAPCQNRFGLGIGVQALGLIGRDQGASTGTGLRWFGGEKGNHLIGACAKGKPRLGFAAEKFQARPIATPRQKALHRVKVAKSCAQPVPFDDVARHRAGAFTGDQGGAPIAVAHGIQRTFIASNLGA